VPVRSEAWRALGTNVHVLVAGGDLGAARAAVTAVTGILIDVDAAYSRFRADSEISRLNARPAEDVPLSPLLFGALEVGVRAARATDGLVDPTVGRAVRLAGYDDDFDLIARRGGPLTIRIEPIPGWHAIRLDRVRRTARIPRGVELDLGSTGKAFAADLAADAASRAAGGSGALVSLGGDIAIAGPPPDGGWRIRVDEDSATPADTHGEVIGLHGGAIATSSTTVRRWERGGVVLHHIIDPRTGVPASGPWRTASVIAETCVDANAAATAAIVLGAPAADWLAGLGLSARLVSTGGEVQCVGDWPAADLAGATVGPRPA